MSNFREIANKMCINSSLIDKYEEELARDDVIMELESENEPIYINRRREYGV